MPLTLGMNGLGNGLGWSVHWFAPLLIGALSILLHSSSRWQHSSSRVGQARMALPQIEGYYQVGQLQWYFDVSFSCLQQSRTTILATYFKPGSHAFGTCAFSDQEIADLLTLISRVDATSSSKAKL